MVQGKANHETEIGRERRSRRRCGRVARGTQGGPCCTPGRPPRWQPHTARRPPAARAHLRTHATRSSTSQRLSSITGVGIRNEGGGGRRRVAFGDVADLAGGGVGEEPDSDLLLLAVAERLAGGDVVRHFRLGRGGRAWAEAETMWSARKGWERRRGVDGWPHGRHVGAQPTVVGGSWRLTMVAVPSLFACVNFFSTNFALSFSKKNQISSLTFFV
jgi:hypothetical protein